MPNVQLFSKIGIGDANPCTARQGRCVLFSFVFLTCTCMQVQVS